MATGASTADLAVVLVDARKGLLPQTRRHSYIASLLGIRHVLLAVNKMDLVGYDQAVFDEIVADYRELADAARHRAACSAIPLSALQGDNLLQRSPTHAVVRRSERARVPGERSTSARGDADVGLPPAGAVGQPARPGFPRLRRHGRGRHACGPATRSWCCRPAGARRVARDRHRRRRSRRGRRGPGGDADAAPTRSTSAAAT